VAGAAISSLIAIAVGIVWLTWYFIPEKAYLRFTFADWKPRLDVWKKILAIGLPAGFEFAMMALYMIIVYAISRPFGAAAQAGFGIGMRVVQAGFMPVVALGFSVAPVAGQNFGARLAERVKATFRDAAMMAAGVMAVFAILCHIAPSALIGVFSDDLGTVAYGTEYLRIVSWNYVASGLIFVTSSMFQAMGNTVPSLISSGVRITLTAIPAVLLSRMPGFQLNWIWYLSVSTTFVQLGLSLWLLRREFGRRLQFADDIRYTLTAPEFEVESYLRHQADTFVRRFDANTYLYTSRALTYFDLARQYGNGSLTDALRKVRARTLLIAFSSDWLYPPSGSEELAAALRALGKDVELQVIEAPYGHDCFLLEEARQTPMIRDFLARRQHGRSPSLRI